MIGAVCRIPINFEFSDSRIGSQNVSIQFVKNGGFRWSFLHFWITVFVTYVVTDSNEFLKKKPNDIFLRFGGNSSAMKQQFFNLAENSNFAI